MSAAIGDHALLSDCRSAALVTGDGVVDWWPAPRFGGASAFSRLLDSEAGHWSLQPAGEYGRDGRRYLPGTLVAETTLRTAGGVLRLTDALAFAPGARGHDIGLEVQATLGPAAGERAGWTLHRAPGMWGEEPAPLDPEAALADTIAAWRSWAELHRGYDGLHAYGVRLSGLVIQGLTYQPTGALVAAPTTSLPELPGSDAGALLLRRTRAPLGNLPQAISHVGLINAASALTAAEDTARVAA